MNVTKATNYDKQRVLEFCKNTFSWGDYISDVWDFWIKEGNLIVVEENNQPVGVSHGSILKKQQVWIEGIRINERYRNRGYAKKMIQELELIGKQNNCNKAMMLIETNNTNSLNLAKNQNYKITKKWNFYSLTSKLLHKKTDVKFATNQNMILTLSNLIGSFYVKSWRWIPLTKSIISSLIEEKKIIYIEKNNKGNCIGIFEKSEHFINTVLLTLFFSERTNLEELLNFFRDYAAKKNWNRIQILCDLELDTKETNLVKRYSFNLLEKNLN